MAFSDGHPLHFVLRRHARLQVYRLLGSVEDRAPEASELENFFGKPRHHLARIIRDLLHPDTVRDNLKDPMTFIVQVLPFCHLPHTQLRICRISTACAALRW